jgi:hypothetical protein
MATLKDTALTYQPESKVKNIADLPQIGIDFELKELEAIDNEGKPFKYKYIEVNGEKFRVPGSVIGMIKDLLVENKNLSLFKVKKSGEGLKTRYTVIPIK